MKVLFVCSGNICRSPMAAGYFRRRVERDELRGFSVDSAGTLRIEGAPASPEAIEAMSEIGVDLSRHRSQGLGTEQLRDAGVVVAMAYDHLDYLARYHPEGHEPRILLRAFEDGPQPASSPRELEDPIGRRVEFYRQQVPLIVRCVDNLIAHLRGAGR